MSANQSSSKPPLFSGEPFERMIAIVTALVTVIAAVLALLEANVGAQTAQALRQSQQYAVQAIGVKAVGEMQTNYAWHDAYRSWLEWNTAAVLAEGKNDVAAVERYTAVRDRAAALTPLLEEPYFNPAAANLPHIRAFEANTYLVENTILMERFLIASDLSGELGDKQSAYGTQLLLTAVALFLYGLSLTIVSKMRWLFVVIGSVIINIVLIWMVSVYAQPVTAFPDAAVVAYAQGVGLAHQEDYQGAIDAFDRATALAPDYANAYYARGNAYFNSQAYESAANSYEAALEAGREDVNVYWNLGWSYYLLGRFEEARAVNELAMANAPEQIALQFNQALTYVADGHPETAQALYAAGLQTAVEQIEAARANGEQPPATLWWYLGTAAADLDNLLNCMVNQICVETPPSNALAEPSEALLSATSTLRLALKSAAVTLEYIGQPAAEIAATGTLENISFAYGIYNDKGQVVDYEPLDTVDTQLRFGTVNEQQGVELDINLALVSPAEARPLFILFDYSAMSAEDLFVMKVYKDGRESPSLRLVERWSLGAEGEVALPLTPGQQFNLTPGEYRVELYLGSTLTAENSFTIED